MTTYAAPNDSLWAAGLLGHAVLAIVLLVRGRWKAVPVFTVLVGFQLLRSCLLFLASPHGSTLSYFLFYWASGFVDYALQLGLLLELARIVLRPTGTWVSDARNAFALCTAVGLLAAVGFTAAFTPAGFSGPLLWQTRIAVFTSLLTCEIFLSMTFAANRLGLRQGRYEVAIGQGVGFWSLITLAEQFTHGALGLEQPSQIFSQGRMAVYLVILLYWAFMLWRPEPARAPLSADMEQYLIALHRQVQYDLGTLNR